MIRAQLALAALLAGALLLMTGCASRPPKEAGGAHAGPSSYTVNGHTYHVRSNATGFQQTGEASWYGPGFNGRPTASGQIYDMHRMTAAHKTLPLGTRVRVTNLGNGRHVVVRINDRGPFHGDRIIDLSYAAARKLHILRNGSAQVRIVATESVGRPSSQRTGLAKQPDSEPAPSHARSAHDAYLQAGAFQDRNHAERQRHRIRSLGVDQVQVRHGPGDQGGQRLYRVRIGPFAAAHARQRVQRTLRAGGVSSFVLGD